MRLKECYGGGGSCEEYKKRQGWWGCFLCFGTVAVLCALWRIEVFFPQVLVSALHTVLLGSSLHSVSLSPRLIPRVAYHWNARTYSSINANPANNAHPIHLVACAECSPFSLVSSSGSES